MSNTDLQSSKPVSSGIPYSADSRKSVAGSILEQSVYITPDKIQNVITMYDDPEQKALIAARKKGYFPSKLKLVDAIKPSNMTVYSDLRGWYNKKYLGGFRNKSTLKEYFNAEAQTVTAQEKKAMAAGERFHRECQTKFYKNAKTQVVYEAATQMTTSSCYVSEEGNVIKIPKKYVTSEEHFENILTKVITIQCFFRRCMAIAKTRKIRAEREMKLKQIEDTNTKRKEISEKKRKKEIESRLHPKTNSDFEIFIQWTRKIQETNRINRLGYSEPARLAALADLLDQEAVLLQKIDRLKLAATKENKEKSIYRLLEMMAAPKKWPANGNTSSVMVDTPNTIRARELRDLFHALNIPLLSVDERLQILLHVKYTVKEFDCNLTRDIVELIDREADLISRGREPQTMEGLRKRISNLFLQFIETPEFNPESTNYQKFPDSGSSWKREQKVYFCSGCTKYLPSTEFYLSTTMKHLGKCKACTMKENIATTRKDDSAYSRMLKAIKASEEIKRATTGVPVDLHYNAMALLQESDVRHLVDVIWNKQSAISSSSNLYELILTRWDPMQEISPWNCVLLTKSEAITHDKQSDPLSLYSDEFKNKISRKHLAAKQHFSQLPAIEKFIKRHYVEDFTGKLVVKPE